MENLLEKLKETIDYLKGATNNFEPDYGIILGTGLGGLVAEIDAEYVVEYDNIPNFPLSTVESHHGKLIFGNLSGKKVVAMQGRFHYYEGYNMKEITFPVRVLKLLDIKALFISNAAGGLNTDYKVGSLMILKDHINLLPDNPLRGKNYDELGPRFPDLFKTYDKTLIQKGIEIAAANNIDCHQGVYAVVSGPNLETPAEYNYLHIIGADAVGMSTVPEALVAKHMGLKTFAISAITDMGYPMEVVKETSLDEIIEAAGIAEPKMTVIIKELIASL